MALKRRRDYAKMWKEFFKFYFIVIISGLPYLIMLVTSEPVCYTRISLDERNRYMKRVDCDGTDIICHRFASSEDVKLGALLDSPCGYPEDYPFTSEKPYKAITCQDVHLPTVIAGYFNCSGYSVGDKCNLTCNDGYYPSATKYAVCEEYDDHKANWTVGNFQCSECNEWNEWNGSEYKFTSTRQTWKKSRQLCESDNSHLVTIGNRDENEFVRKIVWHCISYDDFAFIGLNYFEGKRCH
ncbi:hypothetical protein HOLleu_11097 [Holothuria leucospilota]|uniref:Sushi domain-containing protein n=1 Tax=Holothuria leucospilota TaxID=206669 RepID=A0A9Q1CF79_HOLLE|nr:hypothetical protein HOLleu_11097 [Holothuria leucospilota]